MTSHSARHVCLSCVWIVPIVRIVPIVLVVLCVLGAGAVDAGMARAREPARCPELVVDLGVTSALPALLEVGQSLGGAAGLMVGVGPFVYGVRASVTSASEDSPSWHVTHTEVRLRALAGVRAAAGRGTWTLRLGLGASVVDETRTRHGAAQVAEAGLPTEDSAVTTVPALELEGGLVLRLSGAWGVAFFAGPSLHFGSDTIDGGRLGWTASVSLVWLP